MGEILTQYQVINMKIWQIRAGEDGKHWDAWKEKSIISIGWDIGELEKLTKEEIKQKIENEYPSYNSARVAGFLRTFTGLSLERKNAGYEPEKIPVMTDNKNIADISSIYFSLNN